jgi:hypothetical protein
VDFPLVNNTNFAQDYFSDATMFYNSALRHRQNCSEFDRGCPFEKHVDFRREKVRQPRQRTGYSSGEMKSVTFITNTALKSMKPRGRTIPEINLIGFRDPRRARGWGFSRPYALFQMWKTCKCLLLGLVMDR